MTVAAAPYPFFYVERTVLAVATREKLCDKDSTHARFDGHARVCDVATKEAQCRLPALGSCWGPLRDGHAHPPPKSRPSTSKRLRLGQGDQHRYCLVVLVGQELAAFSVDVDRRLATRKFELACLVQSGDGAITTEEIVDDRR